MQLKRTEAGKLAFQRINKREAAVLAKGAKQIVVCKYKFSNDGGAVGNILFGAILPANSVVTNVISDEISNVTSGGAATIQLLSGSTELLAATAIASFSGIVDHAITPLKVASAGELKIAIGTAALTAGELNLCVEFYLSE